MKCKGSSRITAPQQHTRPCMQGEDESRNSIRGRDRDRKRIGEDYSGRNILMQSVPRSKDSGRAQRDQESRSDLTDVDRKGRRS